MLQSKARLLELNSKLAETLTSKGVMATAAETTTALVNKVSDITSGDDSILRGLIQRDLTEIVIPDGVTNIGQYAFYNFSRLTSIIIPDSVTKIENYAFNSCSAINSLIIPCNVNDIGIFTFANCKRLTDINIPQGVISLGGWIFANCTNLKSIYIPNTIKSIGNDNFSGCKNLELVTLGDGFNANNLDLSASTLYTRETILQWLNALADRTGRTAYKLTIGAKNIAKLTEEDILIATNKNWTLA